MGTPPVLDSAEARLQTLRVELDRIDQRLLNLIRERLDCCARIGMLKKHAAIPMMQPQRVGLVHARAEEYGRRNGINTLFLRQIYDVMIQETCRLEDAIIQGTGTDGPFADVP
jgi:chorismate mutase